MIEQSSLEAMPQSVMIAPLWTDGAISGALTVIEDVAQPLLTERDGRNRCKVFDAPTPEQPQVSASTTD
jgi:hypothetical protein